MYLKHPGIYKNVTLTWYCIKTRDTCTCIFLRILYIFIFIRLFLAWMFFLSFRQNTSIVYIDICRINECNQNMLTFIKYTYGTTCFNDTYLLIFILSMITSKHKMRHKSFVQCSRYYTALLCTAINYKEKPIHRNNITD